MEKHILSKSTFIRGANCTKSLYLNKYRRGLRDKISSQQEAIFEQGTNVGILAQDLFPGGIDCSPENAFEFQKAVIKTKQEIENGASIIYEAAFQFNGVLAALDILVKDSEGWKAYEVKSGTSVSETYELDATLQYYTIINSGIKLTDISIIHLNSGYEKNGTLDIKQLFKISSIKEKVLQLLPTIPAQVEKLKAVIENKSTPQVDIGSYCLSPYPCDFKGYCWKHIPEYSVFNISRLSTTSKFELYKKGILNIKDVPKDFKLNESQLLQVNCEISGEKHIDKAKIKDFLAGLKYPLYYLDFETFMTAVPIFDKSKPYQQIVSQYSLHIQNEKEGALVHKEFLAEANGIDPRVQLMDHLINDCGESGDIIVYNLEFESTRIQEMMAAFPEKALALGKINERLKDLMIPFQNKWYYAPELQGSYSIKKVLPSLVPELSYKNLNIKEGGTALSVFTAMVKGEFKGDVAQTRKDLLEYCKLDTFAMVEIINKLKKNKMGLKFLKDNEGEIFNWKDITRDERYFCAELFFKYKDKPGDLVDLISSKFNPAHNLNSNNSIWELGYEVCFFRDFVYRFGDENKTKSIKNTTYSQKRTFDLALFSNDTLIIIEAKAFEGFENKQITEFKEDEEKLRKLLGDNCPKNIFLIALVSSHLKMRETTKANFQAVITWEDIHSKTKDPVFKRADDLFIE